MPEVRTRFGRVVYEERGDGPPVVLLHAALHDHTDFAAISGELARRYRTIALDWPGHGASDPAPEEVSAPLFAEVLADFVAELALPPAVFLGNSVGGYAAARLALDHPERTSGLVLVNSGGFTRHTPATRAFCRLLGIPVINRRVMPKLVSAYMKPRSDFDRAVTARVAARARTREGARLDAGLWSSFATPAHDLRDRAALIAAPVLLVWGDRDIVLPAKAGLDTHAALPASHLITLPTGHAPFASDPKGFLAAVEPFLAHASGLRTPPRRDTAPDSV
ncbi:alpha/beta hydrolase [Amycolatopsis sp. NPDC004169]|uniref:alpha/beta fold hydrolase n=1 Tax=Amycolatopsis sp. NPDC004169 TaxID=3154453 RepID=UPI0033B07A15